MRPRNNPTDEQFLNRLQRETINGRDPRVKNDAYWALRHQGYNHFHAMRAFRDSLPMLFKEKLELSGEYIDDVDPEELFCIPQNTSTTEIRMAVLMRPEFDEEEIAKASPRKTEYTIWCLSVPGFGVRIRPSGSKSYIVCFRVKHELKWSRFFGQLSG